MAALLGGTLPVAAATTPALSLLLAPSAMAVSLAKFVGAAYLAYLGVRLLLQKAYP